MSSSYCVNVRLKRKYSLNSEKHTYVLEFKLPYVTLYVEKKHDHLIIDVLLRKSQVKCDTIIAAACN